MTDNQVIVITGASAGIGRALVRRFACPGVHLALLARGEQGLHAAQAEALKAGAQAIVIPTDVAVAEQVFRAAEQVVQTWGKIDVWINNAMVTVFSPVADLQADEFDRVTQVTYHGAVWGTMAALQHMSARDSGTIVQVGSALAHRSIPLQAAYCGAKHALRGFTDALRSELLHDRSRIRVTMVQLSAFNTPQFSWARNKLGRHPQPVAPIFQPELAADAIFEAATNPRREMWVGFPAVKAILGSRLIPGFLDRYLAGGAYDGQVTSEKTRPLNRDNLFHAVEGDFGARGVFTSDAAPHSPQVWATMHRKTWVASVVAFLVLILFRKLRRRPSRLAR